MKKTKILKLVLWGIAVVFLPLLIINPALAATTINATDKWAWNDARGWIDFYSTDTVSVSSSQLDGYAVFASVANDYISLNCATSPIGNTCGAINYSVTHDGVGNLAGYAWNDGIGWISFNCSNTNTCATSNYKVTINLTSGEFFGYAWNDAVGWISFNCDQTPSGGSNTCATSNYKVKTNTVTGIASGFLISNTFDTCHPTPPAIDPTDPCLKGAAFNYLIWAGSLGPAGNTVKFQFATSNCSNGATNAPACDQNVGWGGAKTTGDGALIGSGGSSATYYGNGVLPGTPIQLNAAYHNNRRYYRYKVILERPTGNATQRVDSITVNWSP